MGILVTRTSIVEEPPPATFDYYISPTGSDSNDGLTTGTPWAITALNTKRATYAGKRVGLMDGTYDTSAMTASASNPVLSLVSGTSGSPTVIQAVNARQAIFDDGNAVRDPGHNAIIGLIDDALQYIELRDLKFVNTGQIGTYFQCTSGRGVGIKYDGCEFADGVGWDEDNTPYIYLQALDDAEITNCYFHDLSSPVPVVAPGYGVMAILSYGCKRLSITQNTFRNTIKGHHSKYASGSPLTDDQSHTVARNYFVGLDLGLWGYDNTSQTNQEPVDGPYAASIIENNVFESCANALNNPGTFSANAPLIIRNNTMYNTAGATSGYNAHARVASDSYRPSYYNNISYNTGTWHEWHTIIISLSSGTPQIITFDYNCFGPSSVSFQTYSVVGYPYAAGGSFDTLTSLAAWRTATGQEANSILDDPEFLMTGSDADRFKLNSATSPCWNAGRAGGTAGGATRHMGAWDGVVTQIGKDW